MARPAKPLEQELNTTSMHQPNNNVLQQYNKWNDQLYQRYIQLFPEDEHTTIWDGVIFPEEYDKAAFNVMILNREGYTEEGNNYDLAKVLHDAIEQEEKIFPDQHTLRTHLKQYLSVIQMAFTGLDEHSDDEVSKLVELEESSETTFNKRMKKVAYCNIKKSDGQPKSNRQDLKRYAAKGIDILKAQIEYFNPSIILAGDVSDEILEDLVDWGENLYIDPKRRLNIYQLKINGKLYPFFDMFHPSRTQDMSEYYLELLHAMQAVDKEYPNFWQTRANLPKFQDDAEQPKAKPEQTTAPIATNSPTSKAEALYLQGNAAMESKDYKAAVNFYEQAVALNYGPAYRALADFSYDIYYGENLYKSDEWEDFYIVEAEYLEKAAELGDEKAQMHYVEDNLKLLWKDYRIGFTLGMTKLNIFRMKKVSTENKAKAEQAAQYFNELLRKDYQPAIEILRDLQEQAKTSEDEGLGAREILSYIDIPNNLK